VEEGRGDLRLCQLLRFASPLIKPDARLCRVVQPAGFRPEEKAARGVGGLALRNPKISIFPFRFPKLMLCCLPSIRRGLRLAGFHEADMNDWTDQEARQKLLDKINRVAANLEARRKTVKAEDSVGGEGPEAGESGEKQKMASGVGASA